MADEPSKQQLHDEAEIQEFVETHYPELRGAEIHVGLVGGIYRLAVVDSQHVIHTLKIDPKIVTADRTARGLDKPPVTVAAGRRAPNAAKKKVRSTQPDAGADRKASRKQLDGKAAEAAFDRMRLSDARPETLGVEPPGVKRHR